MEVCGVDPGLGTTGYALLAVGGASVQVRDAGVFRTDAHLSLPERLRQLENDFSELLDRWRPDAVGVEQLYSHYKHPRTAILMGHARGVILLTAARYGATVVDMSATQVKRFLTGNGRASKTQMQRSIKAVLGLPTEPEPNDVADALAIGLCCGELLRRLPSGGVRV